MEMVAVGSRSSHFQWAYSDYQSGKLRERAYYENPENKPPPARPRKESGKSAWDWLLDGGGCCIFWVIVAIMFIVALIEMFKGA